MTASAWVSSRPARITLRAGRDALGEGGRKLDQRAGEDVGDQQVVRRSRGDQRMIHAVGDREQQLARAVAELDPVDRGIVLA